MQKQLQKVQRFADFMQEQLQEAQTTAECLHQQLEQAHKNGLHPANEKGQEWHKNLKEGHFSFKSANLKENKIFL